MPEVGWIDIPGQFWRDLSDREFSAILRSSTLNADQCKRLWDMLGRPDDPPPSLKVMVKREDVLRAFPPLTRH